MRLNIRFQEQNETFSGVRESDETLRLGFGDLQTQTASDYNKLINRPSIEGVELVGALSARDLGLGKVYYDTKENWDLQRNLVAEEAAIYIYSNYEYVEDEVGNRTPIAGIKIGDGTSYLIDMPFVSDKTTKTIVDHITNGEIHVTAAEKEFWNNKVSTYFNEGDLENLIFSKVKYTVDGDIMPAE